MQDQNTHFRTSDFCLASFLLAKVVGFIGVNKDSSNRATFFSQIDDCSNDGIYSERLTGQLSWNIQNG